jgi:hypothetical protein
MQSRGVKDWFTGLTLSGKHAGVAHEIEYHHIFPKSLLKKDGYEPKEINELSNMAFIGGRTNRVVTNKLPKDYLSDIASKYGESVLVDELIPTDRSLWELDKYPDFLVYRRQKIVDLINSFLKMPIN